MSLKNVLTFGAILSVLLLTAACASPSLSALSGGDVEEAPKTEEPASKPAEDETESGGAMESEEENPEAAVPDPGDARPPIVNEVMSQIAMVQHHHDPETNIDTFTCASPGLGLEGVEPDPNGPRFVGPNSGDFDLWGAVGLFRVDPDGSIYFVPQQTGGKFLDPDGVEQEIYTLEETLEFFANGDAIWTGAHGEAGRIAECDPQYPVK